MACDITLLGQLHYIVQIVVGVRRVPPLDLLSEITGAGGRDGQLFYTPHYGPTPAAGGARVLGGGLGEQVKLGACWVRPRPSTMPLDLSERSSDPLKNAGGRETTAGRGGTAARPHSPPAAAQHEAVPRCHGSRRPAHYEVAGLVSPRIPPPEYRLKATVLEGMSLPLQTPPITVTRGDRRRPQRQAPPALLASAPLRESFIGRLLCGLILCPMAGAGDEGGFRAGDSKGRDDALSVWLGEAKEGELLLLLLLHSGRERGREGNKERIKNHEPKLLTCWKEIKGEGLK